MDATAGYTFSLLGAVFVLFGWVVYSVIRRAARKRRSILGGRPTFRYGMCGIMVVVAASFFFNCV
jgi:hypothetical protein